MCVTLLGTGDTTGTPTVGCDCETCETARERGVERSRFSVHVQNERTGQSLLVDASPDFRQQFVDAGTPLPDAAVISHVHFDHLDGLGNAYRLVDDLAVHAADDTDPVTGGSVADELDADETRLVHLAHYYPVDEAVAEPLAVDGELNEL